MNSMYSRMQEFQITQLDCKFVSIRRLMVVYFFSGTGSFAPFDMVTVNRSILLTHSGLMRKPE